ncbi:MAG TPA: BrnT family toxin [Terriglobia bacterium]|jgi:hypothetical protein|nr:BrnT family toxin [Terriglobia bacterium]
MGLRFEWNESKPTSNIKKHEVEFAEAVTVFCDPLAREFDDELHSSEERREIIVGHSIQRRLEQCPSGDHDRHPETWTAGKTMIGIPGLGAGAGEIKTQCGIAERRY